MIASVLVLAEDIETLLEVWNNSELTICHVARHGDVNSVQNPSSVTNPTKEPYCILLPT